MTSKPTKSVLITGCSAGGVGAALALTLAQRQSPSPKYLVFATARNPAKIPSSLSSLSNVICLPLDVTSDSSVASTADSVRTHLKERGLKGLDVLVNNAGLGWWFPILDVPMEDAKQIFETNFFGVVRMVQAFGRDVVEAKGCIVNVSSIAGEEGCWEPFKCLFLISRSLSCSLPLLSLYLILSSPFSLFSCRSHPPYRPTNLISITCLSAYLFRWLSMSLPPSISIFPSLLSTLTIHLFTYPPASSQRPYSRRRKTFIN